MTTTPGAVLHEILPRIQALFADRLHVSAPPAEAELLESGLLDSLQFVDLLAAIERQFAISIPLGELAFDRLNTLTALADLVHELDASSHDTGAFPRPLPSD